MLLCRLIHLRITIGLAESVEIQAPHVKARVTQRIPPRPPIEAVGDGQRRRKCCPVKVKNCAAHRRRRRLAAPQQTQKQSKLFRDPAIWKCSSFTSRLSVIRPLRRCRPSGLGSCHAASVRCSGSSKGLPTISENQFGTSREPESPKAVDP